MFRYLGGVYVLMILWVVYDIGETLQCQWWCWLRYNQLSLLEHINDECYNQVSILVQWCVHYECRFLLWFVWPYTHSLIERTLWRRFLVVEYLFSLILCRGLGWRRWWILEGQRGTWFLGVHLDFILAFETIILFHVEVGLLWVKGGSDGGGFQVQQEPSILHHRHNQSIQEMLVQRELFNVKFIVLLDDEEDGLLITIFV